MDPDDTSPNGGATHTLGKHTLVDVGELAVRAADHAVEARDTVQRLEGVVMRHDAQLVEVLTLSKAAVLPQARAIRYAAMVGAGALVVIALAFVTLAARVSSADSGSPRAQATAQK